MPLKIGIFGWASSVHVQRWAKGLAGRELEVKVISLGGSSIDNIETEVIPRGGRFSYITSANKAAELMQNYNPDIVHGHYATGFAYWTEKSGIHPTVVSVWGADVMDFVENPMKKMFVKKYLAKADHITATSKLLKKKCIELSPALENKISIIPFGVTVPKMPQPHPVGSPFKICFIKGHRKKYGPDILLKAFAELAKQNPEVELSMAGEGELTNELKSLADKLGISDKVNFVGFIDNQNIYQFISEHHLMVMPSTMDSESFGVAVIEASACERAVVASDIGGIPEVLIDGKTGLLVPAKDIGALTSGIKKFVDDRDLCVTMGQQGRVNVKEHFDWEVSLDKMIDLYERLKSGHKS